MHPEAARRLQEMARGVIDQIEIGELQTLKVGESIAVFEQMGDLLAKQKGEWFQDDYAWLYAYVSIRIALRDGGYLTRIGQLRDMATEAERNALSEKVKEYWLAVPHDYVFTFPLPGISIADPITICSGVTLVNVPHSEVDEASMRLTSGLSGLLGAARQLTGCPSVKVPAKGLIELRESTEVPAAVAIRIAKIVIQLARVEEIFQGTSDTVEAPPKFATYSVSGGSTPLLQNVTLPPSFAIALRKSALKQKPAGLGASDIQLRSELFSRIGVVVELDGKRRSAKQPPNNDRGALAQYHLIQHCARIATATEWLFDAENEVAPAMAFVQVAIGFEALYGGEINDPIKKTLSNRVAYSLGKSPGEREELANLFVDFYDTRSKVVHTGASRLNLNQRKQFEFGKNVLGRCLHHELSMIPDQNLQLQAALIKALRNRPEAKQEGQ
jgi:hypothetical protein